MNRRTIMAGLLALGLGLTAVAATNLTGTWVLDKSKSDPMRMGGPRSGGGGPRGDLNLTLVIRQSGNDLQIIRKISMGADERPPVEQKFTLDGKECTNPLGGRGGTLTAKAKWNQDTLVIEGTQKMSTPNGDFDIDIKNEYSLSADGKTLTLVSTRSTPQGDTTTKQIFNKH